MPVFSDLTTWRKRYAVDGFLFILKPRIVLAAQVDLPGGVATYPITSVNIKNVTAGDIADVKPGMTIAFGSAAGRQDFGRQRVRSTNDPTINIGWSSPGYEIGAVTIEDDAYITVWELYEAWMKPPYIDKSSGNMFKDKDITLGTNGTQPPPICNSGPGFFIRGTRGGYAGNATYSVTFNGSLSIAVDPDASIDTHSWDFGPNASPTTSTDANPTVDMPYGFTYVEHTVYDTNGNSATQHIPVFIGDQDETAQRGTLSFFEGFRISQRSLKPEGQTFAVEMYEDVDWNDFPDGTLVAYIEEEYYDEVQGSLAGPTDREHIKFIGWLDNENLRLLGRPPSTYESRATFNCVDIGGRMMKLPGFPQELHRKASPTNWLEADNPNLHWWLHYLMYWHSTVLEVADYRPDQSIVSNYPFSTLGSGGANLYDQVDERAKAVNSRLTCDSRGTLRVVGDPGIQITYAQATTIAAFAGVPYRTQTEIMTIGPNDHSEFQVNLTRPPKYHWYKGSALETSRNEFGTGNIRARFCISPGPAPGQGPSAAERTQRLVINVEELLYTHGHEYAMRYNPPHGPVTLTLTHPGDCGLEPAYMEWVVVDTDVDKLKRPLPFDQRRYLIKQVDYQYNHEAHTRQVNLTLEREVLGQPATEIIYEDNEMGLTIYERPDEGDVYVITEDQEENCTTFDYRLPARVLIYAGSYKFFRCRNFNTPDPADRTWEYLDFSGLSWPNGNTALGTVMADPHNNDAVLFWGNHAVGISEDFWTNDTPTMDVLAAIDDGTSGDSMSSICDASVNRVDWFGWTSDNHSYNVGGSAAANNAFYWTDDRFATIHRVALPQVQVGGGNLNDSVDEPCSMDIGHFSTANVGKIWLSCKSQSSDGSNDYSVSRVLRSDDWGQTWLIEAEDQPVSLNSTPSAGRPQSIMPHTLPGGAKNKSYKNLSRFYWTNVFRTPRNANVTQNPTGFGWSGNALRRWTINPYNGKYFAGVVVNSTAKGFFYSKDGGTTIDYYQPIDTLSSIGWWWPNPKFYIVSGNATATDSHRVFAYTVDSGANWTDFSSQVQDAADNEGVSLLATSMIILTDDPLIDEYTCITQVTVTE